MRYCAKSDNGKLRYFPSFEAAEKWAHFYVAQSRHDDFPQSVVLYDAGDRACNEERSDVVVAWVRLDGADRVWTDMR